MANIFIHFEPIGPVGEEIVLSLDLPQYVIRGKWAFIRRNEVLLDQSWLT
jgi:hypothetical protein